MKRGGCTTKVNALTPCQSTDCRAAEGLLRGLPSGSLVMANRAMTAYSGDHDRLFQPKVITQSGDHDHLPRVGLGRGWGRERYGRRL
ncbi:hypothetical protein ACFQU7_29950 [Pseudoroseomonas wenyumeiae]